MAEDGGETRGGRGGKAERGSHGDEQNTHAENEGVQKKAEKRANGEGLVNCLDYYVAMQES